MKRMLKSKKMRMLSFFLTVVMVLTLVPSMGIISKAAETPKSKYDFRDEDVRASFKTMKDGLKWDEDTHTLTMTNAHLTQPVIFPEDRDCTIKLNGNNIIDQYGEVPYGLYEGEYLAIAMMNHKLFIEDGPTTGVGKLTINLDSKEVQEVAYGMLCFNPFFKSGIVEINNKVKCEEGYYGSNAYGINCALFGIQDGTLKINCETGHAATIAFHEYDMTLDNMEILVGKNEAEGKEISYTEKEENARLLEFQQAVMDNEYAFLRQKYTDVNVSYHTHIQTIGDNQETKKNGAMAGTSGQSKRLENIWLKVDGNANLGIQYSTHCQTYGWLPWSSNGELNGTSGESKRLEAIKIRLTGADADRYDVYYRVHAQTYGWLAWAKNGEPSGTAGYSKRLEGIQVVVVKKGSKAPGLDYLGVKASTARHDDKAFIEKKATTIAIPGLETTANVMYKTHVQTFGWQAWKVNGAVSGTEGKAKRLEGINIKLTNSEYTGGICYTTHVQKYGWQGKEADKSTWKKDGAMSGTSGEAKRLEAIRISLYGEIADYYDVYYRVHAQTYGWLAWAKNGDPAGTAGLSKRLEGIQIVLVPKGAAAPANTYQGVTAKNVKAYIQK